VQKNVITKIAYKFFKNVENFRYVTMTVKNKIRLNLLFCVIAMRKVKI